MLYTEDFSMRHYVGFSQIGSHMTITIEWRQIVVVQNFPFCTYMVITKIIFAKPFLCQLIMIFSICVDVKCCLTFEIVHTLLSTLLLIWLMRFNCPQE